MEYHFWAPINACRKGAPINLYNKSVGNSLNACFSISLHCLPPGFYADRIKTLNALIQTQKLWHNGSILHSHITILI